MLFNRQGLTASQRLPTAGAAAAVEARRTRRRRRAFGRILILGGIALALFAVTAGIAFYYGLLAGGDEGSDAGRFARRVRNRMLRGAPAAVTDTRLRAAGVSATDWPLYGGSFDNTRYFPFDQIDVASVHRLRVAWVHQSGPVEKQVTVPTVADNRLYYTIPPATVVAVDAATGVEHWRFTHQLTTTPVVCCGLTNRGVAIYGELVYLATLDDQLIALDRRTGHVRWQVQVADPAERYSITMAPLAADGRIVVGVGGGEYGIRGFVDAYDATTGARLWRFWTVPSPEEGGWWGRWSATTPDGDVLPRDLARERADSAKYADSWRRGGGGVWMTPAYDPTLGLVIFGTGNPAPALDGGGRPGDNLYTCSIVAVDAATGRLRWYYQLIPHDVADHDASSPMVLLNARVGDSTVPAVAHANKTGWVYLLDRRTGRRILRSEPFVPQHNVLGAPTPEGTLMYPAASGGTQWMPPAYSPRHRLLYVLGRDEPTSVTLAPGARGKHGGLMGGTMRHVADPSRTTPKRDRLTAVSMATGKIAWQHAAGGSLATSGALVTAGNLVFVGQGTLLKAFDAGTGAPLWTFRTGGRMVSAPVSYVVGGRQYLAVAATNALFAFSLGPASD